MVVIIDRRYSIADDIMVLNGMGPVRIPLQLGFHAVPYDADRSGHGEQNKQEDDCPDSHVRSGQSLGGPLERTPGMVERRLHESNTDAIVVAPVIFMRQCGNTAVDRLLKDNDDR